MTARAFLVAELRSFPGRGNVLLRGVVASAAVIVISMTLQVPFLALSLIVVFYVTQANIVLSRLVGVMLTVGCTLAIAAVIGLLAFTFDYPLIRIVLACALFFCSLYLMRIVKTGIVFFIVAMVVIYVQTFVDLTDNAEALVRSCLWVWVAVNYAVILSILVNAWLLSPEPMSQLKAEMARQLAIVDATLQDFMLDVSLADRIGTPALQQGAISIQKLLRFVSMRDPGRVGHAERLLALAATVSRLFEAAGGLQQTVNAGSHGLQASLAVQSLRDDCNALSLAIVNEHRYQRPWRGDTMPLASLQEMRRALDALALQEEVGQAGPAKAPATMPKDPFIASDAWTNPTYARFSLRTLLAVLLCYVFYNAVRWPGIHTIMLTCLICALPTSGASRLHGRLRIIGALIGSAIALFMVVFVVPHVDGIVGLLFFSLPVIALGAWIAAGSERSSYAGVQIMFTFSLALLEQFTPASDLTEIRDRIVGILLGVAVSTFLQMVIWPEGEATVLRQRLADVLHRLARSPTAGVQTERFQNWARLADCEAMLARVTLEPDWREGEQDRIMLLTQTVLAQTRSVMVATDALHAELAMERVSGDSSDREATRAFSARVNEAVELYARGLESDPPKARRPVRDHEIERAFGPHAAHALVVAARRVDREMAGLPDWPELASGALPS